MHEFKNIKSLEKIFGWSWKAWGYAFLQLDAALLNELLCNSGKILEVGVSEKSQVSLIFKNAKSIELGVFSGYKLKKKIKKILKYKYQYDDRVEIKECDLNNIEGKYDIIIIKSVLGGIFRENNSHLSEVIKLIENTTKNNLKKGGYFITLDNGYGFMHWFTNFFGARANNWRFLSSEALQSDFLISQSKFGYFSNFSFKTRLSKFGDFLDSVTFFIDKSIMSLYPFKLISSAIIVSVYKNK